MANTDEKWRKAVIGALMESMGPCVLCEEDVPGIIETDDPDDRSFMLCQKHAAAAYALYKLLYGDEY